MMDIQILGYCTLLALIIMFIWFGVNYYIHIIDVIEVCEMVEIGEKQHNTTHNVECSASSEGCRCNYYQIINGYMELKDTRLFVKY